MKLLRYGPAGQERPGLLDAEGRVRDLSAHLPALDAGALDPQALARIAAIAPDELPLADGNPRFGIPYTGIGKFIGIGLNYADHAAEANLPIPTEPALFTKAISCLNGPNDAIMLPRDSTRTDWEVELGVVIGRSARYVGEAEALDHVAGYCVINDVSERDYQLERGPTWDKGKGCDSFGPVGPYLVTADEVADPQRLGLWLDLNGRRMQTGHTGSMIFGVAALVSYVSRFMTLHPGDLIATGTPPGVGLGVKPDPVFLKPGDVLRLGVDGLGEQRQQVVAWSAEQAAAPSAR